jgi:methylated-DNA-[protein]-cysteine S-methyltransferase
MEDRRPRLVGATIDTPIGPLLAIASEVGLCGLPFLGGEASVSALHGSRHRFDARLRRWFSSSDIVEDASDVTLAMTRGWLDAYFLGATAPAALPPLDLRGAAFERKVWSALLDIPAGATTSYGAVAHRLGTPNAARAVGLANGANPVPIIVPCHRVIGASGTLTGYGGGLQRKAWLLAHEEKYWGRAPGLDF